MEEKSQAQLIKKQPVVPEKTKAGEKSKQSKSSHKKKIFVKRSPSKSTSKPNTKNNPDPNPIPEREGSIHDRQQGVLSSFRRRGASQGVVGGKYVRNKKPSTNELGSPHKTYRSTRSAYTDVQKTNQPYGRSGGTQNRNNRMQPMRPTGTFGANNNQRHTNKRNFKDKKAGNYKRKNEILEKEFQVKKKELNLTNPIPKSIDIMETITVSELARKMNLKASDLITKLMEMGMMVTINQQIDAETASILASEFSCSVNIVSIYEETIIETEVGEDIHPRPPVVTVMGHVDHGKTKLLDAIRKSNVIERESGGITQHIGAYQVRVTTSEGKENLITFLDTPGHEAFTLMRARGAQMTDIVILVVAANDGVMPQTIEAIHHAQNAEVPIIVALNKIDLPNANSDRVKQQLSEHNLLAEDWGGQTAYCEISALKGDGIHQLLEQVTLQAEVLELKSNHSVRAEGRVIESKIDPGRGIVATILVERGTLEIGNSFLAGIYPGRIRAIHNDHGAEIQSATPAMPVEITGLSGAPMAGDPFQVTENEKQARQVGLKRQELRKLEEAKNIKKITLHNLFDSIQEGSIQDLKVIIKGDVHGSVEAIKNSLEKLSTAEVKVSIIHAGVGAINESDINLAAASNALVVGFHVRPTTRAQELADREKVEIKKYSIIYDVIEDIRSSMEGMLTPELQEEHTGTVEVREVFKIPKIGLIAGSYVQQGFVKRDSSIRLYREGNEVFSGMMMSLKRFKDDVREVAQGYECGIGLKNFTDIMKGDIIEVFETKQVARKLGASLEELNKVKKPKQSANKDNAEQGQNTDPLPQKK